MERVKKMLTKDSTIIILISLLILIASIPYIMKPTIYEGVDTAYHMSRMVGMTNSWKQGDFLAFIHLDTAGYGYAIGFFYSNLFLIIPSMFYLLGINVITIYKVFLVVCTILSAIAMYITTKRIAKSKYAAIIATILYTMCSYRIINMVLKSFVGEYLSFIFVPIIILGLYELITGNEKKWWICSIGFIGILNSNLVMTEIMIAISAIIILCNITKIIKEKERLKGFLKASVVALAVTAMFWLPMLEQLKNSTFTMKSMMIVYQPYRWLLEFEDMFWGTVQYKSNYAAAYGLGIIYIILLLGRLKIKEKDKTVKCCDIGIVAGLLLLLCMTKVVPWKQLKQIGGMIQFPSRLEVPVAVFFSISCGIVCSKLTKNKTKAQAILVGAICIWEIIATIVCTNSCIKTLQEYRNTQDKEKIKIDEHFTYNICDGVYLPEGAIHPYQYRELEQKEMQTIKEKVVTNYKELDYEIQKDGLTIQFSFKNNQAKDTYIEVPMHYYYGYVAKSVKNQKEYPIKQGKHGLIRIELESNQEDVIQIYYQTTNIQKIGLAITSISIIAIAIEVVKNRRKTCK